MGSSFRTRARIGLQLMVLAVMCSALSPSKADAGFWCWLVGNCGSGGSAGTPQSSRQNDAPEIDPGALASAIALAAGGAAMLGDRVRRRR
jgi:hypothetical protein